jgi:YesN/AraC family two-component response regulator
MGDPAPHILVVDDDPPVLEALTAALKGTYVVHGAATGNEACAILRAHPVAAIILGAVLGEEHGLDLVARFRTLSRARILLLTGHSSEDLAIRAVRTQVDDYLKKPLSLPALSAALDRLLPAEKGPADLAARARRYLDEHPAKQFRAAALARQLGVGEAHLRRVFREAYGKTAHRYLAELRMREAATLLRGTSLGVEQIALKVGCLSVAWFNKRFKRAYGVTPSAYRAGRDPRDAKLGPTGAAGDA